MCNRYICSLQACRLLTLKLFIQGYPWSAKVPHVADFKSAYISLIIAPRGLACETNLLEIMDWESFDVVKFDLGPLLQGQTRIARLKSAYNSLIIDPRGLQCDPTYRKSWAGNLMICSDFTWGPSFKVKGG